MRLFYASCCGVVGRILLMARRSRASSLGTILSTAAVFLIAGTTYAANAGSTATRWIGSWAASQQLVEPGNALSPEDLHDAMLRQVVHLSLGGTEIRVHLSNRFGSLPLHVTAAHVAKPLSASAAKIVPGSDKTLTFSGSPEVTVPAHAEYISDPIPFAANALSNVVITLHIDLVPADQTGHPGSRATSYIVHGDSVSSVVLPNAKTADHWYFIAGIDVTAAQDAGAIAVLGDSITDGHGATTNGNDRWTDVLAQRLQAEAGTRNLAVLNQGIGGNRLLTDGLGPNALSRFDDDVITQPGVLYAIVLEGINDIGMLTRDGDVSRSEHDALVKRMVAAYEQMITRAHTHDIKIIGATIMPFVGSNYYHPGPSTDADRQAVNEWIRTPGHFDAVIDFDKVMRDPHHPERLLPAFDSGDHLHPSPAGYAAMGNAVPVSVFASTSAETSHAGVSSPRLRFGRGGIDQMTHNRRCGETTENPLFHRAVSLCLPLVLAQMFRPGIHQEGL
jgi:lysophospholipase L1-like esterase